MADDVRGMYSIEHLRSSWQTSHGTATALWKVMRASGAKLGGLPPNANCYADGKGWSQHRPVTIHCYLRGDFLVAAPDAGIEMDLDLPGGLKWDFELSAQHVAAFGGVARLNYALCKSDNFKQYGGFGKTSKAREDGEKKASKHILRKWPQFFKAVPDDKRFKGTPRHQIKFHVKKDVAKTLPNKVSAPSGPFPRLLPGRAKPRIHLYLG